MVSLAHAASGAVDSAAGHRRLEPFGGRRRAGDWPGNPPTLAVLAWQWLSQGDEIQQAKGALASLVLLLTLAIMALAAWGVWRLWRRRIPQVQGIRHPQPRALAGKSFALLLPLCGVACALLLAAAAQNSQPVSDSVGNSLWLGSAQRRSARLSACCGWRLALPVSTDGSGCR
jgi:putative thiamine transport system permease protein